ncbi:hypothetical protein P691DRAFT_786880 [Macrolepiota fuliginosa MF-IS2]|uniref:Uncharacterized protein n=1 Tax=Macrolepiota fuliginosa MF-IS2 TaxID=1400762 RepID=A0A9P6C069_9AGAR|nr:hypothetical protein P691DRAFT_786880 [Macrolepiota fuliginosa MF-IS2]
MTIKPHDISSSIVHLQGIIGIQSERLDRIAAEIFDASRVDSVDHIFTQHVEGAEAGASNKFGPADRWVNVGGFDGRPTNLDQPTDGSTSDERGPPAHNFLSNYDSESTHGGTQQPSSLNHANLLTTSQVTFIHLVVIQILSFGGLFLVSLLGNAPRITSVTTHDIPNRITGCETFPYARAPHIVIENTIGESDMAELGEGDRA